MEISRETDDYIRESIEHTLGLPVSTQTLQMKLQASEQSIHLLRNQCLLLQSKLKEKDEIVERARAEASMNAVALKKFVDENQRLAVECKNLLAQCKRWERECSLYDRDREALMDFGNEADQRAKEAEIRVHELEEEVQKLGEELRFYKSEAQPVDTSAEEDASTGQVLLESLLTSIMSKDEVQSKAHAFLEANSNVEVCQILLEKWNRLTPSTHKVLALAAEVKTLQKDKEHLLINLHTAEEEVKVLFEENNMLDEENKRILQLYQKEMHGSGSGGKNSGCTSSAKGNKRKSCSKTNSSVERKIDFSNVDSSRLPLSPLRENSPEFRAYKK